MGNTVKKLLIAFLAMVCLASISFAVACSKEPKYFVLNFENAEGIEYVCDIASGYEVKNGAEVSFSLNIKDNVIGEPVVRANETELKAGDDGVYKFIMKEETNVTVSGTYLLRDYKITFDAGDSRVKFLSESGEQLDTLTADEGTVVKFKLEISVYHDRTQKFDVLANSLIIKPEDGVYSFTVTSDTTVGIRGTDNNGGGLAIAAGFTERENTGSGTKDDPFLISEPVDLYYMRELINNDFNSGYFANAHYKLMKNIDLEGEQIYVLGDGSISAQLEMQSCFSGSFDGNGYTISNYYITETQLNTEGTRFIVPYIGLFGLAVATTESPVEIKNLTLKDFTLTVDGAQEGGISFYAGAIVGYGMGVNITNCKVEGDITVIGPQASDTNIKVGYVGGVAGNLESVYQSEQVKYNSSIVATGTDTRIVGQSGIMYAAGGLVGALNSSDDKATAFILNSYAKNDVYGAINTGGLVGNLGAYSSVKNSYFSGKNVEAYSSVPNSPSFMRYAHSYGGGIAGYANYDSVIADSFTAATVSAGSSSGSTFAHKGDIAGYLEGAAAYTVEGSEALVINSHFNKDSSALNADYADKVLHWVASDWNFEGSLPVPAGAPQGVFTLTINYNGKEVDGGDVFNLFTTASGSRNMAQFYDDETVKQFVQTDNGLLRSYGYYFDSALTQRVPFGYVPSGDVTLYAGFANYNEVAGTYYLKNGDGAYLNLTADGKLFYRYGALSHASYYYYDGEQITLVENKAFEVVERRWLSSESYVDSSLYFSAIATLDSNGDLNLYNISDGYRTSVGVAGNGTNGVVLSSSHYYTTDSKLNAVKEMADFVYGTYYAGTTDYTFYPDGTGVYGGNSSFTYTVKGDRIITNIGGNTEGSVEDGLIITLGGSSLSKYDAFKGVWESSATTQKQYTFDGLGGYKFEYLEYFTDKDGKAATRVIESKNGSYSVSGGILTVDTGEQFLFDENGCLTVDFGDYTQTYSAKNSFAGEWRFFNTDEAIGLTLNGINKDGYGAGEVVYGADNYVSDIEYEAVTVTIDGDNFVNLLIYTEDSLIGSLIYDAKDNTLSGEFYSFYYNRAISGVIFCLYDDFRGKWISSELGVVEFNGLGNYNIGGGSTSIIRTSGEVIVNDVPAGRYILEGYNLKGTFTYDGKTYSIIYNEATKLIEVTESELKFNLVELDGLYNLPLVAANGDKYSFNGGGYLADGGVLSRNGEGLYTYKINSDGETEIYALDGSEKIGKFGVENNAYVISVDETDIILTLDNLFTGSWVVGGPEDGTLVIGAVGADNTASGSYLGTNVTFEYDIETGVLSFNGKNGEKLNINSLTAMGKTELEISERGSVANSVICVKEEFVSSLKGTYKLGGNKTVYLDGMDETQFGKGTAMLNDGNRIIQYTYTLSGDNIILRDEINKEEQEQTYILKAVAGGYELVVPDALFNVRVGDAKKTTYYRFDGIGTVTATSGTKEEVFSYTIDGYDEVKRVYTLTITNGEQTYTAVYEAAASRITLTLNTEKE